MEVKLEVLVGKMKHREIPLPSTLFVIGRHEQCHLRPHCELVSKLHCAVSSWAGQVYVKDLNSSNGTFVNEQRIKDRAVVQDGDTLRVGNLHFAFRIRRGVRDQVPVHIVERDEVSWLMNTPADSSVLDPGCQTQIVALPASEVEHKAIGEPGAEKPHRQPEAAPRRAGSGAVSAGQYLRDYFHQPRT